MAANLYWASNHKWYLELDGIAYGPFMSETLGTRFHSRFDGEPDIDKSKSRKPPKLSPNGTPVRRPFRTYQYTSE